MTKRTNPTTPADEGTDSAPPADAAPEGISAALAETPKARSRREARESKAAKRVADLNGRLAAVRNGEPDPGPSPELAAAKGKGGPTKRSAEQRLDEQVGSKGWSLVVWAPAEAKLLADLIDGMDGNAPTFGDDERTRLTLTSAAQAKRLIAALDAVEPAHAYQAYLVTLAVVQTLQAFPATYAGLASDDGAAVKVAVALNELRDQGIVADWRAYAPVGQKGGSRLLSFRVTMADGTVEDIERPKLALVRVEELQAEAAAA